MKHKIKLGSVGSRGFLDRLCVYNFLDLLYTMFDVEVMISGGCKEGADKLSADYAKVNRFEIVEILAEWERFGIMAGKIRNGWIVDNINLLVAFWDGSSGGTGDTIEKTIQQGKDFIIVQPIQTISKSISNFSDKDCFVFFEKGTKYEFVKKARSIDVHNKMIIPKDGSEYRRYKNLYLIHYNSK